MILCYDLGIVSITVLFCSHTLGTTVKHGDFSLCDFSLRKINKLIDHIMSNVGGKCDKKIYH
jgi:hypothetical protein